MAAPTLTLSRKRRLALPGPVIRFWGLAGMVLKRQWHNRGLTLLALLGVVLAVGLVTSANCFSAAVSELVFSQKLAEFTRSTHRPAFSTRVYLMPSPDAPLSLEAAERAGQNVVGTLTSEVGAPARHLNLQVESGSLMLYPREGGGGAFGASQDFIGTVEVVYKEGIEKHLSITEGEPMAADASPAGDSMDVWIHTQMAEKMGAHVGETYLVKPIGDENGAVVRLRGFWKARDPESDYWFSDPDLDLNDAFLVSRADYARHIEPLLPSKTRMVAWHIILDERHVIHEKANQYIAGFGRAVTEIDKYLPEAKLDTPPLEPLKGFAERELLFTVVLLGFNIPALGLLLYFLFLISSMIAHWQRREISTLVSRGANRVDILTFTLVDEVLLFIAGAPLGVALGMGLAWLMGFTTSFLSFTSHEPLPMSVRWVSLPLVLAALIVHLVARLWSAAQVARLSVVELEREQARPQRAPFWHRAYMDVILVVPTAYAYHQLTQRGTLALLVQDRPEDMYRDPLLIIVPALFVLTAALLVMRLFPLLMRVIDAASGAIPWIMPHLALRELGRQSLSYMTPLLLVIVTLALGAYSWAMAASLDQWLVDRMQYQAGTDLTFEPGLSPGLESDPPADGAWIPLPQDFAEVTGVTTATRVGDFAFELTSRSRGRFLAIDRVDFPSAAWFRRDLASLPLNGLMNVLAVSPNNVLVSPQFLKRNNLLVGDKMTLRVTSRSTSSGLDVTAPFVVAGTFNYFPTVYEEDQLTLVGNLDYLADQIGVPPMHSIWLRLQPGADGEIVQKTIYSKLGVYPSAPKDARALVTEEQARRERAGVFGTLSIGFMAAVVMACVGLLIYIYASLQDQLYRLTVLRAIGLFKWQVLGYMVLEYACLIAYGAAAGGGIGILAAKLFAPFFRVTAVKNVPLPPLIPVVPQDKIIWLSAAFAAGMIALLVLVIAWSLARQRFTMLRGYFAQ